MSYYSDNTPTVKMSSSTTSDIIEVSPQFPMTNQPFERDQHFEPHSALDGSHSFRRTSVPNKNQSNARRGPPPNRPTGNIFFKTRICTRFGFGTCRNGESCTFAHGADEIRQPPPNWQELVSPRTEDRLQLGRNLNDHDKIIHKMKLCKKYCNGEECRYGDNCNFLHEDPAMFRDESWNTRESSAISIGTSNHLEGSRAGIKPEKGTYWKTKICLRWINTGSCPFGDNCHFAHGDEEVQVSSGGIEAEAAAAAAIANSTKAVIPTIPTTSSSVNYAPTTLPANVPTTTEEERMAKKELLWKKLNKINRIYGDWIDDLPSTEEP